MTETIINYVEPVPAGGWRVTGSRVTLDSLVHGYWEGQTPEAIAEDFPSLSLEKVYGALAFYFGHREEVDRYMAEQDELWEQFRQQSEAEHAPLLNRLRESRKAQRKEKSS